MARFGDLDRRALLRAGAGAGVEIESVAFLVGPTFRVAADNPRGYLPGPGWQQLEQDELVEAAARSFEEAGVALPVDVTATAGAPTE